MLFSIIVILLYLLFVRTNTTYNSDTKSIEETIKLDLFQYNQKILIKNINKYIGLKFNFTSDQSYFFYQFFFKFIQKNNQITSLNKFYADDNIILSVMSSEECLGKIQANLNNAYKQTQEWLLILTQKSVQLCIMAQTIKSIRSNQVIIVIKKIYLTCCQVEYRNHFFCLILN